MLATMMLEPTLDTFHIFPDSQTSESGDDSLPLQRSRSYYDHTVLNTLPRLLYNPPTNFGMVTHNLYRSSFPQKENFAYLRKLGLKSVL